LCSPLSPLADMTRGPDSPSPLPHWFQSDGSKKMLMVDLPSLDSLQGVDLDISGTEVRLQLPGSTESLRIPLPVDLATSPETAAARFSRKRRQLTIAWDVPPVGADQEVSSTPDTLEGEPSSQVEPRVLPESHGVTELAWKEKEPADSEGAAAHADCQCQAEPRPCLDLLQAEVEHALKQCTVEQFKNIADLRGCTILLGSFAVKGEATMTGRSCRFKASVSLTWEALDAFGGQLGASGTALVPELTEAEMSPHVVVRSSPGGAAQSRAVAEWMKRRGAQLIAAALSGEVLGEAVASAGKLEEDSDTGGSAQSPGQAQKKAPKQAPRLLEDKCMKQWAEAWLAQKLGSSTVRLFGGLAIASLEGTEVSGTASVSGSTAAPTMSFHLRVACTWVLRPSAAGAKEIRGTLCVPQFTSEQRIKDCPIIVEAAPGQKSIGQYLTAFKQSGIAVVRSVLEQFVSELQVAAA